VVRLVEIDSTAAEASACLARYYAELDRLFPEGFAIDRSHDPEPEQLRRPRGAFIVARDSSHAVGCIALKGTCPDYAELKRLWVDPAHRGSGLAKALMDEAERIARELGHRVLRLDTHRTLTGPIAMYRRWGWQEIARFNDDPYAHLFFEKWL
jgi:GNAT superfamily N-acetyltransferase